MAAKYGHLINKWTVAAVAALALMAALLATVLPAGAQDRPPVIPDAQTIFDYAENGNGPIATYSATDPEIKPVFWTLGGADAADFTIVNGALRFKSPPNYEVPTDRINDEDGSGTISPAAAPDETPPELGEGAGNNIYKVTVRFGAGGEDGTPGEPTDTPADEYDGDDLGEVDLTINVTNVDEQGMMVISPMQPQEGTELTAILTDEDNVAPGTGEWQWARDDSMTGTFDDFPPNSGDMTYRPTKDDLGKYLRVTVDYVDRAGPEVRTVQAVSAYRVRKDTNTSNQDPKFPDQSTLTGIVPGILAPVRDVTDRFIPEIAAAGTRVGAPVTAFDDKTDIEVITYSLRDANGSTSPNGVASDDDGNTDTPRHNDGHAASFDIDAKTGQITVGARAMLDADGTDGAGDGATNPYSVVVRAVDGDGDTENIDVDIHVLMYHEPPVIDRVYQPDRVGDGHLVWDRVPTEMSHYESDRTPRSAFKIDSDLESGVLVYIGGKPYLKSPDTFDRDGKMINLIQAATYWATDRDGVTDLCWTLEGDDERMFRFKEPAAAPECDSIGPSATLWFSSPPDFEKPGDLDKDNVYEVTIVVKDGTVDMNGNPHRDELPVTVKVINSTEDNKAGEVKFSNRVPEVATKLTATHEDKDGPVTELMWQWYRSVADDTVYPAVCPRNTDGERYFIDTHPGLTPAVWEKIDGAIFATYTPGYDEDSGGTSTTATATGAVTWTGGDIGVTISTDDEGNKLYSDWTSPRCLRATVTYRDAVDRTHAEPDDDATRHVDETLEGTFQQTEYPVKPIDEENDAPEFLDPDEKAVSVYRADDIEDIAENTTPSGADADYTLLIKDAPDATELAASDPMAGEDDDSGLTPAGPGADILTYSLSGADKDDFVIVGSIENPTDYDPDGPGPVVPINEQGALVFLYPPRLNYEKQREYRVTVTATDPSGEHDSVTVNVNITDVNEGPVWVNEPRMPVYTENEKGNVATYLAEDPETSGVTYSLITVAGDVPGTDVVPATGDPAEADADEVVAGEFEDHALFNISSTRGTLTFKESPNYEDPKDVAAVTDGAVAGDNMYQVVVKAEVADDENPRHATIRKVTVTVINVNEAPVFFETTDTLEISENPDDPEKEATSERGELYLLNRGVGKPAANLPAAPNLDLGVPVVAVDDDNTWTAKNYLGGTGSRATRPVQLIDGLTYELMGADAGLFDIVPATGQILTKEKLDYEAKKTHTVRVKATDPWGLWDNIDVTINVTDVDEAPVSGLLTLTGNESHTYAENGVDTTLGIYKFSGARTGTPAWTLEGADADYFMLERSSSTSRTLKFKESPNYEMPRGQAVSAANTYPYMVTVKVSAGNEMNTRDVTVTVTNVEEPGMVKLSSTGGKVGTPLTAALTDDDIVMGPIEWLWSRVDRATGNSTPITGARSSSYTPVAADVDNLLMVTASYTDGTGSGQSASDSITTPVADANAAPEFAAVTATHEVAENMSPGTLVGSPVTATDPNGNNLTYRVSGVDAASFTVDDDGQLETSARFDYEAKSSYSVTITATDPEGLSGSIAVTVNVTNVDEGGMASLSPTRPSVGTPITASVTDPDSSPTGMTYQWSHSTAMGGPFTPYPAETTARFTPAEADVGRYLRVTVSYNDVHGAQTESATTEMAVMAVMLNVAPAFSSEAATRSVAENTAVGMNIGDPVMATDYDNDTLRYMLSGTDAGSFDIGMSTGQLMTKAALDYETKMSYMVTVTATDPDGASDSIMVTIMVTDVDEVDPVDPVVARYDTNGDGEIQKSEVIAAINDYLFPQAGVDPISKAEVIRLINLYLFG